MRIFVIKVFRRWAKKEKLSDSELVACVKEIKEGLIDAVLGGNLIKKRVARSGQGKSGGYRTILAYKEGHRIFFLYGFSKNEKGNISSDELKALRMIGKRSLDFSDAQLKRLLEREDYYELNEED